jgi:hypothetical protein
MDSRREGLAAEVVRFECAQEIPQILDRIADVCDLVAAVTEATTRKRALSVAGVVDSEAVLELPLGAGQVCAAATAADPNGAAHGIDICHVRRGGRASAQLPLLCVSARF